MEYIWLREGNRLRGGRFFVCAGRDETGCVFAQFRGIFKWVRNLNCACGRFPPPLTCSPPSIK